MDAFQFEGRHVSARQLRKTITAYSEGALQTALESGCQSLPAVMAYLARRDARMAQNIRSPGLRNSAQRSRSAPIPYELTDAGRALLDGKK